MTQLNLVAAATEEVREIASVLRKATLSSYLGKVSELTVAARLVELGLDVFLPVRGDSEIDLIAMNAFGRAVRIQVKRVGEDAKRTRFKLRLRRSTKTGAKVGRHVRKIPYTKIDIFVAMNAKGESWVIPWKRVANQSQLWLYPGGPWQEAWQEVTEMAP